VERRGSPEQYIIAFFFLVLLVGLEKAYIALYVNINGQAANLFLLDLYDIWMRSVIGFFYL